MRVFKDVGLVEQLGSGMSRILKVYPRDIFEISDHFIKVHFKFKAEIPEGRRIERQTVKAVDKKAAIKSGDKNMAINTSEGTFSNKTIRNYAKIITYLQEHNDATASEIMDLLGIGVSRTKVLLKELVRQKKIEPCGGNRNRTYALVNSEEIHDEG